MANITEIPELVKIMISLFGEKWGKRLGRTFVILALVTLLVVIITTLFGRLSINMFYTVLGVILALVAVVSVPVGLGLFFGMIIRVGLATPMHSRIESILEQVEAHLLIVNQDTTKNAELLHDLRQIRNQWNESKIVRVVRRLSKPKSEKSGTNA